jgi:hypothetical protein
MILGIERGWWGRWHVYELGHFEGDRFWVASFRHKQHAQAFIRVVQLGWTGHPPDDPVNHMGLA